MGTDEDGSDRSRAIALTLGFIIGPLGAHRYYVGKIGTGVLQTLTIGGCGLWWLYDMVLLSFGAFRDSDGLRVKYWTEGEMEERGGGRAKLSEEVLEEIDSLREEVAELSERVDFTERLLARDHHDPRLSLESGPPPRG